MRAVALIVILAAALAGCVDGDDAPAPPVSDEAPEATPEPEPWSIALTRCSEAGPVAAYPREPIGVPSTSHVPAPWVLADVREELGDPHVSALGQPMVGDVTGHWHMAFVCAELRLGWVGVSVEPPPFDHGGADRHMLLSGLSIDDDRIRAEITEAAGFEPNINLRAEIVRLGPALLYSLNDDEDKGVYEGVGPELPLYARDNMTVRWWLTVDRPDGHRPISFDVHYLGGVTHGATRESLATGCHTRTQMHGAQGGLCGPSVMATYDAPAVHLAFNGRAGATLDEAWHH